MATPRVPYNPPVVVWGEQGAWLPSLCLGEREREEKKIKLQVDFPKHQESLSSEEKKKEARGTRLSVYSFNA